MSDEKLKPCPFCASDEVIVLTHGGFYDGEQCCRCETRGPCCESSGVTWNSRVPDTTLIDEAIESLASEVSAKAVGDPNSYMRGYFDCKRDLIARLERIKAEARA